MSFAWIKSAAAMLFAAFVCLVIGTGVFQVLQFLGAPHIWSDLGAIFAACVVLGFGAHPP